MQTPRLLLFLCLFLCLCLYLRRYPRLCLCLYLYPCLCMCLSLQQCLRLRLPWLPALFGPPHHLFHGLAALCCVGEVRPMACSLHHHHPHILKYRSQKLAAFDPKHA